MNLLTVSSSPHIQTKETTSRIMLDVVIALIPAGIASVWFFGVRTLWIILLSVASAVLTEFLIQKIMNKPVTIIFTTTPNKYRHIKRAVIIHLLPALLIL
jgi:electron transport complex protein RnfD